MSSRDLSVPRCPWGKPGPWSLLAPASNCIGLCLTSTLDSYSHNTYLATFWASVPLLPFGPRGWDVVVLKEIGGGQQEQSCVPVALTLAQLLQSLRVQLQPAPPHSPSEQQGPQGLYF